MQVKRCSNDTRIYQRYAMSIFSDDCSIIIKYVGKNITNYRLQSTKMNQQHLFNLIELIYIKL
jgi:hypothetical protein